MPIARTLAILLLLPVLLTARAAAGPAYRIETVAEGFKWPWALAFLPDGDMLVSEKHGQLRLVRRGSSESLPITGGPSQILQEGDSGLLDIALDPDFAANHRVFLAFNEGTEQANHIAVYRAKLDDTRLTQGRVIYRGTPDKAGPQHSGGRLAFLADRSLLVTVGDGFTYRDAAQDLGNSLGKVMRIDRDGKPASDNPFRATAGALPEIFTWGHRNAMGLLVDPRNGDTWLHENVPRGGDEINLLKPGLNYGWPKATFGIDYSGEPISKVQRAEDVADPVVIWTPSIAPSGFTLYLGDKFPQWTGDFFVGALAERSLRRVRIVDGQWVEQEILLKELKSRIRDVRAGPDGYLYVLTDSPKGQLLRLVPR